MGFRGLLVALVILLIVSACGSKSAAPVNNGVTKADASLEAVLNELEQQPTPEGVDDDIYSMLKEELARILIEAASGKTASTPPTDEASATPLFLVTSNQNLYWGHFLTGDYDQNGVVNINDLTPLGVHFGKKGGFESYKVESIVDGNGDGEINISDVTAIGQNFQRNTLGGYAIYEADDPESYYPTANDEVSAVSPFITIPFDEATGDTTTLRKQFVYHLDPVVDETYYWVRPLDDESTAGSPSNMISTFGFKPFLTLDNPPTLGNGTFFNPWILDATTLYQFKITGPLSIDLTPSEVSTWYISNSGVGSIEDGVGILDVNDDFDGYFYVTACFYDIMCSGQFFFRVIGPNDPPVANLHVDTNGGTVPLTVNVDGSASTDLDGVIALYEFDWDIGLGYESNLDEPTANHEYTEGGRYEIRMRVTDNDGDSSYASAWVFVDEWHIGNADIGDPPAEDSGRYCQVDEHAKEPRVVYSSNDKLMYAARSSIPNGSGGYNYFWSNTAIDETAGTGIYFSLDHYDSLAAVAYVDTATNELKFARATVDPPTGPADWEIHTVAASLSTPRYVVLDVDSTGPVIAYLENMKIKYAKSEAASPTSSADWHTHTVTTLTSLDPGTPPMMDFKYLHGTPGIVFRDHASTSLRYAYSSVSEPSDSLHWTIIDVDTTGDTGMYPRLTGIEGIVPMIAYYDASSDSVKAAYATASPPTGTGDWMISIIDSVGDYPGYGHGNYISINDSQGDIVMAYSVVDGTEIGINFAVTATPFPTTGDWVVSRVTAGPAASQYLSIGNAAGVIEGYPGIAFYDADAGSLKYARWIWE